MEIESRRKRLGVILIVSGPSGAGKTTVCNTVMKKRGDLYFSVSCTTRSPREGEVDGQDYYFVSMDEFKAKAANNEFIEHAEVYGNFYGTLKSELTKNIMQGRNVLLDIDVQGAMQIKDQAQDDELIARSLELVFIGPPSFAVLEKRLRGRKTEPEEIVRKRLDTARHELGFWREYDYLLLNEELDTTVREMDGIVDSIQKKTSHMEDFLFDA